MEKRYIIILDNFSDDFDKSLLETYKRCPYVQKYTIYLTVTDDVWEAKKFKTEKDATRVADKIIKEFKYKISTKILTVTLKILP